MVEEKVGAFSAFEIKLNNKKVRKKFPVTFLENYPISQTMIVSPENADDFFGDNIS